MPTIDATVGGVSANSYETLAEANVYHDERIALVPPWVTSGDSAIRALITATRTLDSYAQPFKTYIPGSEGQIGYFYTRRRWTGAPATATQRLAWPRTGMYDGNGNAILDSVIPQELKDAQSELAGQFLAADLTLDSEVIKQGVTSVKAGSVSVSFKTPYKIDTKVIPDAVFNLMPPSWFTDEIITYALSAEYDVL